eukprot:COSAG06_NODE_22278_length_728_cov_3.074722_2_plen_66_part_01
MLLGTRSAAAAACVRDSCCEALDMAISEEEAAARQEAIDYFCSLSFVYETDSGPSDETNLLDLKQK